MDMGSMGIYRIFDEGDHKAMGDGGMLTTDVGCFLTPLSFLHRLPSK
jgi:hypothetical protein